MVRFSQHHLIAFVLLHVNMMLQLVVPANAFLLRPSIPSKTPFSQSIRYYQQKQQQSTTLTATRHPLADAAAQLLPWEQLASAQDKPILNLSGRDDSPEDTPVQKKNRALNTSAWDTGERWQNTWSHLCEVLPLLLLTSSSVSQEEYSEDGASLFVTQCPQLLRFESDHIRETASWMKDAFGEATATQLIQAEPRFLSFRSNDVAYGVEFMATMSMMTPELCRQTCAASPAFFMAGIEGGIQERTVHSAWQSASQATQQATQRIVGDAASSAQALKAQQQQRQNKY